MVKVILFYTLLSQPTNKGKSGSGKTTLLSLIYPTSGLNIMDFTDDEYTAIETPVIKQNAYPYNYVTCSQAQALANNMELGNYTSSLMFGVQWDLVLKYLETKGTAQGDLNSDSKNWGNYQNNLWNITNENSKYAANGSGWTSKAYGVKNLNANILLSTGASDTFCKQGIYDLAGNVWEWTLEYTSYLSNPCSLRGGYCISTGSNDPANSRANDGTGSYNSYLGFRTSLF